MFTRTDDAAGAVELTREWEGRRVTLLLHCGEGTLPLPAYAGRQDLLTGQPFAGALGAYGVAVVEG